MHVSVVAKLYENCEALYRSGEGQSGVWPVDIDGSGPLPPTHMYCEMGVEEKDGHTHGISWVSHNLQAGTSVRSSKLNDLRKLITYR